MRRNRRDLIMAELVESNSTGWAASPTDLSMRASDADRHATVLALQDAMARGLLNPDEGGERMAAAYGAVHLRDLHPLTADLPQSRTTSRGRGWQVVLMTAVEKFRSWLRDADTGRLYRSRVAAVILLAIVLVCAIGFLAVDPFDGGGGPVPRGFGHR